MLWSARAGGLDTQSPKAPLSLLSYTLLVLGIPKDIFEKYSLHFFIICLAVKLRRPSPSPHCVKQNPRSDDHFTNQTQYLLAILTGCPLLHPRAFGKLVSWHIYFFVSHCEQGIGLEPHLISLSLFFCTCPFHNTGRNKLFCL